MRAQDSPVVESRTDCKINSLARVDTAARKLPPPLHTKMRFFSRANPSIRIDERERPSFTAVVFEIFANAVHIIRCLVILRLLVSPKETDRATASVGKPMTTVHFRGDQATHRVCPPMWRYQRGGVVFVGR